jgi:hypothetical protein
MTAVMARICPQDKGLLTFPPATEQCSSRDAVPRKIESRHIAAVSVKKRGTYTG